MKSKTFKEVLIGVLERFEKGIERALSSTFARAFKADLKPVDIASALRGEMDSRTASLSRGRTVVPNVFVIELGGDDLKKVDQWGMESFRAELIHTATNHATDQGYVFVGPVQVTFDHVTDLKAGQFRIRSSSQQVTTTPAESVRDVFPGSEETPMDQPPNPQSSGAAQPIVDVDGQRYLLTGEVTVFGRGSESDIVVSDPGVSRRHVEIRVTPNGVIATDLNSTNGTYVEGHKVDAVTLVDGNTLTIGRTTITFWAGASGGSSASGGVA